MMVLVLVGCGSDGDSELPGRERSSTARLERLQDLPYVGASPVPESARGKSGVTRYLPSLSYDGLNLYAVWPTQLSNNMSGEAVLMDMRGNVVHRWSSDVGQIRTSGSRDFPPESFLWGWSHVEMSDNGDLFALVFGHLLLKLDWNSNVIWEAPLAVHHDLAFADNGDIYALTEERRTISYRSSDVPIMNNHIVVLGADGSIKRRISIYDVLMESETARPLVEQRINQAVARLGDLEYQVKGRGLHLLRLRLGERNQDVEGKALERLWRRVRTAVFDPENFKGETRELNSLFQYTPLDIFHANSIEIIEGENGLWNAGDLLISVKHLNLIGVVDIRRGQLVWSWGPGVLEYQHHPSVLQNGNILVYDNGSASERTRILEIDPRSKKIVWTYGERAEQHFFSIGLGGVEALANGNILIADSTNGRLFEITREGEIVWEFFNPVLDERGQRFHIYRVARIEESLVEEIMRLHGR
jgi:hypothetical protein